MFLYLSMQNTRTICYSLLDKGHAASVIVLKITFSMVRVYIEIQKSLHRKICCVLAPFCFLTLVICSSGTHLTTNQSDLTWGYLLH